MLECSQRCTSSAMTTEAELTLGGAELIEVLFNHGGTTAATASLMGIRIPLTEIPPEYSEVSKVIYYIMVVFSITLDKLENF